MRLPGRRLRNVAPEARCHGERYFVGVECEGRKSELKSQRNPTRMLQDPGWPQSLIAAAFELRHLRFPCGLLLFEHFMSSFCLAVFAILDLEPCFAMIGSRVG
jgi:hypothetical protein